MTLALQGQPRRRIMTLALVAVLAVSGAGLFAISQSGGDASAQDPPQETICHSRAFGQPDGDPAPYISLTLAIPGILNGHADQHQGPIWFPGIEGMWGDIIPPLPPELPNGLNWTAEGIAIWENDCEIPTTTPTVTETVTETVTSETPTVTETVTVTTTATQPITQTATVTETPTETTTATETATETVTTAGTTPVTSTADVVTEQQAVAGATPAPPSTGTGTGRDSGLATAGAILAGLIAMTAGATLFTIRRR